MLVERSILVKGWVTDDRGEIEVRHKNWLVHKQTACGKDFSNPFMVDNLPKIIGFSTHLASVVKSWLVHDQTVHALASPKANELTIPEQTATGKTKEKRSGTKKKQSNTIGGGKNGRRRHNERSPLSQLVFEPSIRRGFEDKDRSFYKLILEDYISTESNSSGKLPQIRTLANGTQQLVASIDSKEYTITEASVRSKLQLADATGIHNLSDAEIYAGLATLGPKSGGWDQFGSTVATALICLSSNRVYNFSKMIFDGMVHNLESNTKFLMYPRFLQIILDINTEYKGKYLAPTLTKKLFANMKRGYAGDFVPLLPAMLAGAAMDQGDGSAQPAEPHHTPVDPLPSTSLPPIPSSPLQSPPHSPLQSPPHSPLQSPPHSPLQSPPHSPLQSPPYSPPHYSSPRSYEAPLPEGNTSGSAEASIQLKELMVLVPNLVKMVTSLEKELKETKPTLGNVMLKLVKKVKSLEIALKRKSKKVIVSASEGEEPEDQGRIIQDIDDDPLVSLFRESMKEKSTDFVTPTKASGEAQEEEISPTILEAAKTLSKVASQSVKVRKSSDGVRGYPRTTHKTKETNRQEEARLERGYKIAKLKWVKVAKTDHLDKMVAKMCRNKRKCQSNTETERLKFTKLHSSYTEEDGTPLGIEQKLLKNQKFDTEDASITKGKYEVEKEVEAESATFVKDKVKDASSESEIGVDAIPTATKPPTIVNWKIISQSSQKALLSDHKNDIGYDKKFI
ncbi:hypothetical protein Tco_1464809 [Tanacetum coccineum]